jgi:hypothetical protein
MKINRVTVTIRQPKGDGDPGQVAEGRYILEDNTVTLTNHVGTPVRDHDGKTYSKKLEQNEDAYAVAGRLTKEFRRARRGDKNHVEGFSSPIHYPRNGSIV